jgi:hypothetical protein
MSCNDFFVCFLFFVFLFQKILSFQFPTFTNKAIKSPNPRLNISSGSKIKENLLLNNYLLEANNTVHVTLKTIIELVIVIQLRQSLFFLNEVWIRLSDFWRYM